MLIESFTPHVAFNEDIMFGDMLSPIERKKTSSHWMRAVDTSITNIPCIVPKLSQKVQTSQFEGETGTRIAPLVTNNLLVGKKSEGSVPLAIKQSKTTRQPHQNCLRYRLRYGLRIHLQRKPIETWIYLIVMINPLNLIYQQDLSITVLKAS